MKPSNQDVTDANGRSASLKRNVSVGGERFLVEACPSSGGQWTASAEFMGKLLNADGPTANRAVSNWAAAAGHFAAYRR